MRIGWTAAIAVFLLVLLTFLSLRAVNPEAEQFDRALAELDRLVSFENALHGDILAARAGMLRNYDPLVREVNALRDSLDRLRNMFVADADAMAQIDRLAALIDRQEELVETFKSDNALLHNSLAFFGRLGAIPVSPDLNAAISAAAASILSLTLDTSASSARDVAARLDELEQQAARIGRADSVDALLAHGRLLHRLLPAVDETLKLMRVSRQTGDQEALRRTIVAHQVETRTEARRFRQLLYITSLALLLVLIQFGLRLRSRAKALQRSAALEHVIAGISMRFINARPQTIDTEIDRAVAELAGCIGADRAYFIMAVSPKVLHVWHKDGMAPSPGWPAGALELAEEMGTGRDGLIHVPRVDRMAIGPGRTRLLELGLGGWACATSLGKDGKRVALGFEAIGRPCRITTTGELTLVRMALDTIVQAVERQAVDTERARLEVRLRQAQRMEKIGIFTSGIAHNFNNILGGILGHCEVMEELAASDARLLRNLATIRQGAERARDLVEEMLGFGRRRDRRRKPLSLGALIAETAMLMDAALPPGVDLIIRQPPVAAIVSGDNAQLQQVILNLCNNAVHAMRGGGRVEISTELHEIEEARTLSHDRIRPGKYVCVTVADTGEGMDDATLGRIFEPFFTTRFSGNGLGLATVREIVHEHGGTVSVQSSPGHGSRFEVWLPRATAGPMPDTGAGPLRAGRGETIMLVVHDNERLLRYEDMLAALGCEPVGFSGIDAALAACRTDPDRFDMAIIGHIGTLHRSLELAASLHATAPRLPIVLATKAAIEIGADALVSAGIFDVVRWPIVAEEFAMTLAHASTLTRTQPRPQGQALLTP